MLIPPLMAIPTACLVLLAAVLPAAAEDGVSADKIMFGQAAALGGPAGALGQGMKIGMEAAFAEVNKVGGVKGRKLELKSVDDGYEPTQSIEVIKKLLADDKVFAIAGPVNRNHTAFHGLSGVVIDQDQRLPHQHDLFQRKQNPMTIHGLRSRL